jgi:hypothetical protein
MNKQTSFAFSVKSCENSLIWGRPNAGLCIRDMNKRDWNQCCTVTTNHNFALERRDQPDTIDIMEEASYLLSML